MVARLEILKEAIAAIPTANPGYVNFGWDSADGLPKYKDEAGVVSSFFGATEKAKLNSLVYDVVADYGAKDDLRTVFDGAMTSGSGTLTCATSTPFAAGDVGKRITVAGAGASGAQLTTTIASFSSSSVVVLTATASANVSAKGVSFGTDNTTAIQNAINAAQTARGGIVWFPVTVGNQGRYGITSTLLITGSGISLWGPSTSHTSDVGDYTRSGGAWICWWGTTSQVALKIAPTAGAGNTALIGSRIDGLSIDCRNGDQNNALIGLQLWSCHGGHWTDFFVIDALAVAIDMNVVATLGEARDCTRWRMERFCVRQLDNPAGAMTTPITMSSSVALTTTPQSLTVIANTLPAAGYAWVQVHTGYPVLMNYTGGGGTTTLTGCTVSAQEAINTPTTVNGSNVVQAVPGNACCIRMDGDTTANTCCSTIDTAQLSHGTTWGPAAIEYRNSDSIETMSIMINGGNATADGAINRTRKPGVRMCGSNTNATLAARNNVHRSLSAGAGGLLVLGVTNAAARLTAMSQPHYLECYQLGNGEGIPIVEGNAYVEWTANGALMPGHGAVAAVADQAIAAATLTLIAGSMIAIPPQGFQIGTTIRWTIDGISAAVGVAANTITVRVGTAGTTADAAVATFTTGVGAAGSSSSSRCARSAPRRPPRRAVRSPEARRQARLAASSRSS
jgi:hypothetical protein